MPLFVVLRDGAELTDELGARIKQRIREECSPRHVPNEIHAIAAVPTTLSGKVLEVPVKRILMGTPPEQAASRDALTNPESLNYFAELAHAPNPALPPPRSATTRRNPHAVGRPSNLPVHRRQPAA